MRRQSSALPQVAESTYLVFQRGQVFNGFDPLFGVSQALIDRQLRSMHQMLDL